MTHRFFLPITAVLSLIIALMSYRFLALGVELAFPPMLNHIQGDRLAFFAHIIFAPIALALATFQLMPRLRSHRPRLHRWAGRSYGVAVLIAGIGGLVMALNANGGLISTVGFALLALLWLTFTALGVQAARARQFAAHRRWMIRSFALTFTAVTLRLQLFTFMAFGYDYLEVVQILAWLCWVPNVIVAEAWLARDRRAFPA